MSRTRKPGAKAPKGSTKTEASNQGTGTMARAGGAKVSERTLPVPGFGAPTIVKVHAAKTHLSRLLQRVAHGGRVLIANGNRDPGFELVLVGPSPSHGGPRRFGALRGVVTVDQTFFEPLPAAELEAWER